MQPPVVGGAASAAETTLSTHHPTNQPHTLNEPRLLIFQTPAAAHHIIGTPQARYLLSVGTHTILCQCVYCQK